MALAKKQSAVLAKQVFEYAPAPEAIDHIKIQPHYGLFIGGKMVAPHSKKRFPTINPATEEKLSDVVEADHVDVDRAVKAANNAFDSWAHLSPSKRARYLFRISRMSACQNPIPVNPARAAISTRVRKSCRQR